MPWPFGRKLTRAHSPPLIEVTEPFPIMARILLALCCITAHASVLNAGEDKMWPFTTEVVKPSLRVAAGGDSSLVFLDFSGVLPILPTPRFT